MKSEETAQCGRERTVTPGVGGSVMCNAVSLIAGEALTSSQPDLQTYEPYRVAYSPFGSSPRVTLKTTDLSRQSSASRWLSCLQAVGTLLLAHLSSSRATGP